MVDLVHIKQRIYLIQTPYLYITVTRSITKHDAHPIPVRLKRRLLEALASRMVACSCSIFSAAVRRSTSDSEGNLKIFVPLREPINSF